MTENRLTKKWLKNHWAYSWWKYLALTVICVLGIDMLFVTTAYRPPEHKKIELYVANFYVDQEALSGELEPLFFEKHPDQEEFSVQNINLSSDDVYVRMQFSTYIAAQQGDVLLVPAGEVEYLSGGELADVFLDLTPYIEIGAIDVAGVDMTRAIIRGEEGEEGIYAIPADSLQGLIEHGNNPENSFLCVTAFSGNEDVAVSVLDMLLERYQTDAPQWYLDQQRQEQNPSVLF